MIIYSLMGLTGNAAVLVTSQTMRTCVDTQNNLMVDKAGDTMTGALAMSNSKVTGLAGPTAAHEAATKDYVDTVVSIVM